MSLKYQLRQMDIEEIEELKADLEMELETLKKHLSSLTPSEIEELEKETPSILEQRNQDIKEIIKEGLSSTDENFEIETIENECRNLLCEGYPWGIEILDTEIGHCEDELYRRGRK